MPTFNGTTGPDVLTGTAADDTINGLGGDDIIDGGLGNDTLNGGLGLDTLIIDALTAAAGAYTIDLTASTFQNTGAGQDLLSGFERVRIINSNALQGWTITGTAGNDVLEGGAGDDILNGGGLDDVLVGGDGDDILNGGAGVDLLIGGLGADQMNGGAGTWNSNLPDVVDYSGSNAAVTIDAFGNGTGGYAEGDTLTEIEGVIGSAFNDTLRRQYAWGGDGDDTLTGANLYGGSGNDTLFMFGATGTNVAYGGLGADTINGESTQSNTLYDGAQDTLGFEYNDGEVDILNGGSRGNVFHMGLGDTANGGTSTDTAYVNLHGLSSGVNLTLTRANSQATAVALAGVTLTSIENVLIRGTGHDDVITLVDLRWGDGGGGNDILTLQEYGSSGGFLYGGSGNDTLYGTNYRDELYGGAGDDTLYGGGTRDVLNGGDGNDILDGGHGDDVMSGGLGDDTYYVDNVNDVVSEAGGGGIDTAYTSVSYNFSSIEHIVLTGTGNLEVSGGLLSTTGNSGNNTLYGGGVLDGGAGNDALYGYATDDTLIGGDGLDILRGGLGNDTYILTGDGDLVYENANEGIDTIRTTQASYVLGANLENLVFTGTGSATYTGNALNNAITGGADADTLNGGLGNDTLNGGDGNDRLYGGAGTDTLTGGLGDDWYYVDAGDVIVEAAGQGVDRVWASTSYTLGAGVSVEIMSTDNHAGTGAINLTGNAFANTIYGNAGNNVLDGGGGADVMTGWGGDDWYFVDHVGDVVVEAAGQGADRVFASVSYVLGAGVSVEIMSTTLHAGTTAINLTGNELANTLYGNAGANILRGGGGADILHGQEGDDQLHGDAGIDTLRGGTGNDWYYVDTGDVVIEAAGEGTADRVFASSHFVLTAGAEIEAMSTTLHAGTTAINLTGNELGNLIYGNEGANVLSGMAGADTLHAGGGDDVLIGGSGNDHLNGGAGYDIVVLQGNATEYTIEDLGGGVFRLTHRNGGVDGIDILKDVELMRFADIDEPVVPIPAATAAFAADAEDATAGRDGGQSVWSSSLPGHEDWIF